MRWASRNQKEGIEMPVSIKFGDLPKTGLPTVGDWSAVVQDAKLELNRAGDGYNIIPTFEFTGNEYAGKTIKTWLSLKGRGARIAYDILVGIGAIKDGEDLELVEDPKTNTLIKPNLINLPCVLRMRKQEGSDYSEVAEILPPNTPISTGDGSQEPEKKARPTLR